MKLAADFRETARTCLTGRWGIAVVAGLVAVLLGAIDGNGPEAKVNLDSSGVNASLQLAGQTIFSTGGQHSGLPALMLGTVTMIAMISIVISIVCLFLGSILEIGYARFNLNLVDGQEVELEDLFSYFFAWKTAIAARIMVCIYVALWSLLLIVPGIMATYSYAMTSYILAEYPDLPANEAIRRSKEMMAGNRWRLFCLQFSFIGWKVLCTFTCGIGNLWLIPYEQAATAAFYREISGTSRIVES